MKTLAELLAAGQLKLVQLRETERLESERKAEEYRRKIDQFQASQREYVQTLLPEETWEFIEYDDSPSSYVLKIEVRHPDLSPIQLDIANNAGHFAAAGWCIPMPNGGIDEEESKIEMWWSWPKYLQAYESVDMVLARAAEAKTEYNRLEQGLREKLADVLAKKTRQAEGRLLASEPIYEPEEATADALSTLRQALEDLVVDILDTQLEKRGL